MLEYARLEYRVHEHLPFQTGEAWPVIDLFMREFIPGIYHANRDPVPICQSVVEWTEHELPQYDGNVYLTMAEIDSSPIRRQNFGLAFIFDYDDKVPGGLQGLAQRFHRNNPVLCSATPMPEGISFELKLAQLISRHEAEKDVALRLKRPR